MDLVSLYLHIPFCRHRCSYCDFNTFAGQNRWIPPYIEALCHEIQQVSVSAPGGIRVHTIFFGGGTPSIFKIDQFARIFSTLRQSFDIQPDVEVTIEANPGTVSPDYLAGLREVGVNRLSFGMQSAHPIDLCLLERQHDFFDVSNAVRWARQAGFDNLSLDLIFGLPGQSLDRWRDTLERALGLAPEHLSLYALTIEPGTPLHRRWSRGLIPLVDDDLAADMYEYAQECLYKAGYEQYEISNWARTPGSGDLKYCRHNVQYWKNQPYLGFGAGAHGYSAGVRTENVGGIRPYIERCKRSQQVIFPIGPAALRAIAVNRFTEMQETMMVGLRLTQEGVSELAFQQRFGQSINDCFGSEIQRLFSAGLLEWTQEDNPHLRLTRRGRLLGNQVFMQFVS